MKQRVIVGVALAAACGALTAAVLVRNAAAGQAAKTRESQPSSSVLAPSATPRSGPVTLRGIRMVTRRTGWGVSSKAVLRTNDWGGHWKVLLRFSAARWPFDFSLRTAGAGTAWVLVRTSDSRFVVLSTHNAGGTWHSSAPVPSTTVPSSPSFAGTISFANAKLGWLLRIGKPVVGRMPHQLYRTLDGGLHWTEIESSTTVTLSGHSLPACVDAVTSDTGKSLWATGQCDIQTSRTILYHSADGGRIWRTVILGRLPGFFVTSFATFPPLFHGAQGILPVYLSQPGAYVLYASSDHGRNWHPTTPVYLNSSGLGPGVATFDGYHVWLAANQALYASRDRGLHWNILYRNPGLASSPQIQFLNRKDGYAVTAVPGPRILVTLNGGHSFHAVPTAFSPTG
jgi:hypothetical protein